MKIMDNTAHPQQNIETTEYVQLEASSAPLQYRMVQEVIHVSSNNHTQ